MMNQKGTRPTSSLSTPEGLGLCLDLDDGYIHLAGGTDPVIGPKVRSLAETLAALKDRGVLSGGGPLSRRRASYAVVIRMDVL